MKSQTLSKSLKLKCLLSAVLEGMEVNVTFSEEEQKRVDEDVELVMAMEDDMLLDEVLADMGVFHGGSSRFEPFYIEMEKLLGDQGLADDRRHSQVSFCSSFVSVRDWRQQVIEKMPEGSDIPSERLLYKGSRAIGDIIGEYVISAM